MMAGVSVVFMDGKIVSFKADTYLNPRSPREVIANGMILTMQKEIEKTIENYKKFTEREVVQNNGEKNEF